MSDKQFLQETNFADELEQVKPEDWTPAKSNETIRRHNEKMWKDASIKDQSY